VQENEENSSLSLPTKAQAAINTQCLNFNLLDCLRTWTRKADPSWEDCAGRLEYCR